jgi:hypothetical protein
LGNDILIGGAGADTLTGGSGVDTVEYSTSTAGITINLTTGTGSAGGDAEGDILSGIENAVGSDFNDTISGGTGIVGNVIDGGDGKRHA